MARGAVTRLAAGSRHVQRDLQRLGDAWCSPTSCFKRADFVPHAEPFPNDLGVVLPHLASGHAGIVRAAFAALRRFAVNCRHRVYPSLPPSVWDVPATVPAVAPCLGSEHVATRLGASALVQEFPSPQFRTELLARLEDPLFTVRWRAIAALARSNVGIQRSLLADALASAIPRQLDQDRYPDYFAALDALDLRSDELKDQR